MDTRERTMDRDWFSDAVWALRASMLRVAMSYMRSRTDAEDAVQDAVLAAWQKLGSLRDPAVFKTWMLAIVANTSKMALRKKKRIVLSDDIEPPQDVRDEMTDALWESVMALDEKLRLPIVLHYYEGFSVKEIASIVHAPTGTVAARMNRARARLKKELTQRGDNA